MRQLYLFLLSICFFACADGRQTLPTTSKQNTSAPVPKNETTPMAGPLIYRTPEPISQFVRRIFEDEAGRLWLGTNGDGVLCYYQGSLTRHFRASGFEAETVRAMVQDKAGYVWFGTNDGLIRFDPAHLDKKKDAFKKYTSKDKLVHNDIWSLCLDNDGNLWIGTYGGVSLFDGFNFKTFELPPTSIDSTRGVSSPWIVHHIMQDRNKRIWFATNDGVQIWDGQRLASLTEAHGLCNKVVNSILEDEAGNFWFATHHAGICRLRDDTFTTYDVEEGIKGLEAWSLFQDKEHRLWFPVENDGLYMYNGTNFELYTKAEGLPSHGIQCVYQDRKGTIWAGGYLGLAYFDGQGFVQVEQEGPWP